MNNIFKFATKELSQDAFLCWSINWITEELALESPFYRYGKAMLDLFLSDKKLDNYYDVKVLNQHSRIDVLIMFKDLEKRSHALIIEDKTNTSEHSDQLHRYKEKILQNIPYDDELKAYDNPEVHLAYIKTGIMYDEDIRMVGKGAVVVNLDTLLDTILLYSAECNSEILSSFCAHLQEIKNKRTEIELQINNGQYESAMHDAYGQFYFFNKVFDARSKGSVLGNEYIESNNNRPVYYDTIYSGNNTGGTPWTQYCF